MDIAELLKEYGFPVAVASYLLWNNHASSKRSADNYEKLQTLIIDKVLHRFQENTDALRDNTTFLKELKKEGKFTKVKKGLNDNDHSV